MDNEQNVAADFESEMLHFISEQKLTTYGDNYWNGVASGVIIMFRYRNLFNDKEAMMWAYQQTKRKLELLCPDHIHEDFADEFEAIFIRWYPMPDFWTATLDDFKQHFNSRARIS